MELCRKMAIPERRDWEDRKVLDIPAARSLGVPVPAAQREGGWQGPQPLGGGRGNRRRGAQ